MMLLHHAIVFLHTSYCSACPWDSSRPHFGDIVHLFMTFSVIKMVAKTPRLSNTSGRLGISICSLMVLCCVRIMSYSRNSSLFDNKTQCFQSKYPNSKSPYFSWLLIAVFLRRQNVFHQGCQVTEAKPYQGICCTASGIQLHVRVSG